MPTRKYRQKKRAVNQEETRQRIVEATVYLHQKIGVRDTSISAIAKEAEVERLTVYRHFEDDYALLTACTSHYFSQNPLPDSTQWESIEDTETCLRTALTIIYAWYHQTEEMVSKAYRDVDSVPTLREVMFPFFEFWDGIRDRLTEKTLLAESQGEILRAAIGHAIHFQTWSSLVGQQGLTDEQAVELMLIMILTISKTEESA